MRFGTDTLQLANNTITKNGPTTILETSLQQLKASMILWLANNPIQVDVLDIIQSEVSALAW